MWGFSGSLSRRLGAGLLPNSSTFSLRFLFFFPLHSLPTQELTSLLNWHTVSPTPLAWSVDQEEDLRMWQRSTARLPAKQSESLRGDTASLSIAILTRRSCCEQSSWGPAWEPEMWSNGDSELNWASPTQVAQARRVWVPALSRWEFGPPGPGLGHSQSKAGIDEGAGSGFIPELVPWNSTRLKVVLPSLGSCWERAELTLYPFSPFLTTWSRANLRAGCWLFKYCPLPKMTFPPLYLPLFQVQLKSDLHYWFCRNTFCLLGTPPDLGVVLGSLVWIISLSPGLAQHCLYHCDSFMGFFLGGEGSGHVTCGILVLWRGTELKLLCSGSAEPETLDHQGSPDHCYSLYPAGLSCCPTGRPPALELLPFLLILSFSLPVSGSASWFSPPGS